MHQGIRCELITWDQVEGMSRDLARRIRGEGFVPDLIIALGRGGWIPGRLLSDNLSIPNLTEFKVEHYTAIHKQEAARVRYPLAADPTGQRVLVVDDVTDTGDSFDVALQHIRRRGEPAEMRTVALHHKTVSPYAPDYYGRLVKDWRWIIYPWAMVEDLSALIEAMETCPREPERLAERLLEQHGLDLQPPIVRDILALMPHPYPKR